MKFNTENTDFIAQKDAFGGEYYIYQAKDLSTDYSAPVGIFEGAEKFACSYLADPFFLKAWSGSDVSAVPAESEWLAVRYDDKTYSVLIPLVADGYRTVFSGDRNGLIAQSSSGDKSVMKKSFRAFYHIHGEDIIKLIDAAAESIASALGIRIGKDKKLPAFAKWFGWCTWNAFYCSVSEEKMKEALEAFREGGFVPKFVLLDDGWQSVAEYGKHRGNHLLSSFRPNEKFGGDLSSISKLMKEEYGVKHFMVWHAMGGYWGGASPFAEEMQKYGIRFDAAIVTDAMFKSNPNRSYDECFPFGLPEDMNSFYDDYHSYLASTGVDGVKIDVQSIIASHGRGNGGRECVTKKMRKALEASVRKNFNGNVINCMANTNDIVFNTSGTNMMRTSNDYGPSDGVSSFRHIFDNAVNSMYIGIFSACDWDMFWTKNTYGEYHAMARAISGGPVYVSDKPGNHDFDIIRRLTASDGSLFLCEETAKLDPDSLFAGVGDGKTPLVIYNVNKANKVTGVFSTSVETAMEYELQLNEDEVLFTFSGKNALPGALFRMEIVPSGSDVITVAKLKNGFAPLGIKGKYNGGAAVLDYESDGRKAAAEISDGGELIVYSDKKILSVTENGNVVAENLNAGFSEIKVPGKGTLNFSFGN